MLSQILSNVCHSMFLLEKNDLMEFSLREVEFELVTERFFLTTHLDPLMITMMFSCIFMCINITQLQTTTIIEEWLEKVRTYKSILCLYLEVKTDLISNP